MNKTGFWERLRELWLRYGPGHTSPQDLVGRLPEIAHFSADDQLVLLEKAALDSETNGKEILYFMACLFICVGIGIVADVNFIQAPPVLFLLIGVFGAQWLNNRWVYKKLLAQCLKHVLTQPNPTSPTHRAGLEKWGSKSERWGKPKMEQWGKPVVERWGSAKREN
ncbi:MAG: hypothetical protein LBE21_04375 [Pseudomonadales bacterium]|nr:hypothetical protein [Pseudomonadales bacterium]